MGDEVEQRDLLGVMVLMTLVDGEVDEDEVIRMRWIHGRVVGRAVSEAEIRAVIADMRGRALDVEPYLESIRDHLTSAGKRRLLQAAFAIATADGRVDAREDALMIRIARALEIPPQDYRAALSQLRLARELEPHS